MLYNLYRISDAGRAKEKIKGATKINCLKNFISVFGIDGLYVFADNCQLQTIDEIKALGLDPILTSLGNAGSFRYVVDFSLNAFNDSDHVYLIEDDYWHLPESRQALMEGLKIADYVTLYDHPDKYVSFKSGGPNPLINDNGENSKVFLTETCHWKTSNSTTMTFATNVAILKADRHLMWKFTRRKMPADFDLFFILTRQVPFVLLQSRQFYKQFVRTLLYYFAGKKRVLITALPGFSTHIENAYLSPLRNWEKIVRDFIGSTAS